MSHLTISRRVFIGSLAYLVTAPTLAFVPFAKVSDSALPVTTDGQFFTASELTILADIAEILFDCSIWHTRMKTPYTRELDIYSPFQP